MASITSSVRPKIALAHHWLHVIRGGERVLEQFSLLFPRVPIYTLFHRSVKLGGIFSSHSVKQSALGLLPGVNRYYRSLLPFYPLALRSLTVSRDCDFLLSCDASMIKGLQVQDRTKHCSYSCSPPRYLFEMQEDYLDNMKDTFGLKRKVVRAITPYLQESDIKAAQKVDSFITLSSFIKERIRRVYRRDSEIIAPPVAVTDFRFDRTGEGYYLIVSALVPYKRIDLAIRACNHLRRNLVVIGNGPDYRKLLHLAGPTVKLLGGAGFKRVKEAYERCDAFLFPGVEDFGITAVEAQAAGKPVIGIKKGGLMETVVDNETGVLFEEQSVDSLVDAILRFEQRRGDFLPAAARRNAEYYKPEQFRSRLKTYLESRYPEFFAGYNWPI